MADRDSHDVDRGLRLLEGDPSAPRHLITEPGIGYRFQPENKDGEQQANQRPPSDAKHFWGAK